MDDVSGGVIAIKTRGEGVREGGSGLLDGARLVADTDDARYARNERISWHMRVSDPRLCGRNQFCRTSPSNMPRVRFYSNFKPNAASRTYA